MSRDIRRVTDHNGTRLITDLFEEDGDLMRCTRCWVGFRGDSASTDKLEAHAKTHMSKEDSNG